MKFDRTFRTVIVLFIILVILISSYFVQDIISKNNVASVEETDLSLTGAKLSDSTYAKMVVSGTWDSAVGVANQFDFTIFNADKYDLANWTISIQVPAGSVLDNYWGSEAELDKSTGLLVIKPTSYNNTILSDGNITFGIIVSAKEAFSPTSLHLQGYKILNNNTSLARRIVEVFIGIWAIVFIGFLVTRLNFRNYREKQKNDIKIILQSMNTFINFIDAKDPYTRGHSKRVAMYAAEIAKRMRLPEDDIQNIYYAGLLHDAGKISVPDAVLNKPGVLTKEERTMIQNHTVAGGKMLVQLSSLKGVRETALYHHERYDGSGYPDGLKGDMIPLFARIVGVADAYDAMSSNRVYRRHLNKDEIIEEIQKGAGTQFDPRIVTYMVDMINDGYVNVVKMETADNDESYGKFNLTEEDIPGVYMGF
ncbi:Cellulose binding domain-containing protein [Butyrivibrio hungatei DSM 14810]|uniref:Cellulose binding domain-containing protein n=1 Tax=Butyrivibrio hungatei DSM 14810 TaxID=1121132 RepID=A0A1M7S3Q5_9FIRM|nr:HD domain-containing phosphohydrolase [Butyrivibrio hungatei]SHN52922.1 Cellulose binding domain-containing protein [Butyrivibrio hungatei DSM 14810]